MEEKEREYSHYGLSSPIRGKSVASMKIHSTYDVTKRLVYLPVYVSSYTYDGKSYRFCVRTSFFVPTFCLISDMCLCLCLSFSSSLCFLVYLVLTPFSFRYKVRQAQWTQSARMGLVL